MVVQSLFVSDVIQVTVRKEDVINNHDLMGVFIENYLKKNNLPMMTGCAEAVRIFNGVRGLSTGQIHRLECMEKFKDKRKQFSGKLSAHSHWNKEPTKKEILNRLAKKPKSQLKQLLDASADSSLMFNETFVSLTKRY